MPRTPQLSIQLRTFSEGAPQSWDFLFDRVEAADAALVDRVVVSEHLVFGSDLSAYNNPAVGGTERGQQPTGPDGHWLEPLTVLANLAARTQRVRLATGILLAPLRRPVVLAKAATTLDVLSGGRFDLGVGIGWQQAEYDAAGVPFSERGHRLDQALEICHALWCNQTASFSSSEISFENIHMMPKPVHGTVPVWVSGTLNDRAMRRLARFGTGWIPWGAAADNVLDSIPRMREAVASFGRDPEELQVVGSLPVIYRDDGTPDIQRSIEASERMVSAGATDLRLSIRLPRDKSAAAHVLGQWASAVHAME